MMREYTFDVKLFVDVTVEAESEEAARKLLDEARICVTAAPPSLNIAEPHSMAEWPDAPFIIDGESDLLRIDGEDVE